MPKQHPSLDAIQRDEQIKNALKDYEERISKQKVVPFPSSGELSPTVTRCHPVSPEVSPNAGQYESLDMQGFSEIIKTTVTSVTWFSKLSPLAQQAIKAILENFIYTTQFIQPIPFTEDVLASFPTDLFPEWGQKMISMISDVLQVSEDMPGAFLVTAIAGAIQGKVQVCAVQGYVQPACIYMMLVAQPSEKKSPVFKAMQAPFFNWQANARETMADSINKKKQELRIWEAAMAKAEAKAAQNYEDSNAQDDAKKLLQAKPEIPLEPRLIASDCTPEKLTSLLAKYGRLIVTDSEGGLIGTLAGRYSKVPNFDIFLKAHGAETVSVERGDREEWLDSPVLTIALTCQYAILKELQECKSFQEKGLLSRFLFVLPKSNAGYRRTTMKPMNTAIQEAYEKQIERLLGIPENEKGKPYTVFFTNEALSVIEEKRAALEVERLPGGLAEGIEDWHNKQEGLLLRLALIHHMAKHGADGIYQKIDRDSAIAAVRLEEYFWCHVLKAYDYMKANPTQSKAMRIIEWSLKRNQFCFTRRDVWRALRKSLENQVDMDKAIEILKINKWIYVIDLPEKNQMSVRKLYILSPFCLDRLKTGDTGDSIDKSPANKGFQQGDSVGDSSCQRVTSSDARGDSTQIPEDAKAYLREVAATSDEKEVLEV